MQIFHIRGGVMEGREERKKETPYAVAKSLMPYEKTDERKERQQE